MCLIGFTISNIFVAGSNPHPAVVPASQSRFPTEFRVEYLNPDFITTGAPRPSIVRAPQQLLFNQKTQLTVNVPPSLRGGQIKGDILDIKQSYLLSVFVPLYSVFNGLRVCYTWTALQFTPGLPRTHPYGQYLANHSSTE